MSPRSTIYGKIAAQYTKAAMSDIALDTLRRNFEERGYTRAARAIERQRVYGLVELRRRKKDLIRLNKKIMKAQQMVGKNQAQQRSVAASWRFDPNSAGLGDDQNGEVLGTTEMEH
jgi:hypothetical protein